MKKQFKKELIMIEGNERNFQTSRYSRVSAHQSCNVNFRITNKITILSDNLIGHEGHHIMQEIGNYSRKVNLIPNDMEKIWLLC